LGVYLLKEKPVWLKSLLITWFLLSFQPAFRLVKETQACAKMVCNIKTIEIKPQAAQRMAVVVEKSP